MSCLDKHVCPKPASNYCTPLLSDRMYFILLFANWFVFFHWWFIKNETLLIKFVHSLTISFLTSCFMHIVRFIKNEIWMNIRNSNFQFSIASLSGALLAGIIRYYMLKSNNHNFGPFFSEHFNSPFLSCWTYNAASLRKGCKVI
jgi:cation transport ATPase